jgi:hypothetical protein
VRTEVRDQTIPLAQVKRNAFVVVVVVITETAVELQRVLADGQKPLLLRGHRRAGRRIRMHDKRQIVARHMHRGMNRKACCVDFEKLGHVAGAVMEPGLTLPQLAFVGLSRLADAFLLARLAKDAGTDRRNAQAC